MILYKANFVSVAFAAFCITARFSANLSAQDSFPPKSPPVPEKKEPDRAEETKDKPEDQDRIKAIRDKDDLAGRLMRKSVAENDEGLMGGILRLMSEASRRMEIDFDPGERTQEVQTQIASKLDEAIKLAASQRKPQKRNMSASGSDKRKMPSTPKPTTRKGPTAPAKTQDSSTSETATSTTGENAFGGNAGELRELRRTWGQLPEREREEIIQGSEENYLERYRQWIEKYYRALQESAE